MGAHHTKIIYSTTLCVTENVITMLSSELAKIRNRLSTIHFTMLRKECIRDIDSMFALCQEEDKELEDLFQCDCEEYSDGESEYNLFIWLHYQSKTPTQTFTPLPFPAEVLNCIEKEFNTQFEINVKTWTE